LVAKKIELNSGRYEKVKEFRTSREIHATPQTIFDAISHPNLLAKWWGPEGFTNTFNLFQFQNGGKWSFIMHGPDGNSYPNENEFVEIIEASKVVIRHVSEPKFTLTITIAPYKKGSIVAWVQAFESEQVAKHIAQIVIPSNEQNLNRLEALVCGD
jgi:uncharacterized protein YndB with AHSA1/START domain